MRKLKLEVQVSIDGYMADVNGKTDWMIWNWGPDWKWDADLQRFHTDLTKSVDCILLSRKMAEEGFIAHWKQVTSEPENAQFDFARHITDSPKVVFTKTLNKSVSIPGGWDDTVIADGDYVSEVEDLKNQRGKDIIVYGGSAFVSSLIKAKLIDEFYLIMNPVVLGSGLPVFNLPDNRIDLSLIASKHFGCGVVLLHYNSK